MVIGQIGMTRVIALSRAEAVNRNEHELAPIPHRLSEERSVRGRRRNETVQQSSLPK